MSRATDLVDLIDVQRSQWDPGDRAPRNRSIDKIDQAELHHTGAPGPRSLTYDDKRRWLLEIERFHEESKNWSDIFYHLFVFADGEIWGGRPADRSSQGDIPTTMTVHVPGNNPGVTPAQYESLLRVVRWTTSNPAAVRGHNQRPAATYCPGPNVLAVVDRLRIDLTQGDEPVSIPENLIPEDLGGHEQFKAAEARGFLSGQSARSASRSVVGVVATRVDDAARQRDAVRQREIKALRTDVEALKRTGGVDIDAVVAEVIRRLENG